MARSKLFFYHSLFGILLILSGCKDVAKGPSALDATSDTSATSTTTATTTTTGAGTTPTTTGSGTSTTGTSTGSTPTATTTTVTATTTTTSGATATTTQGTATKKGNSSPAKDTSAPYAGSISINQNGTTTYTKTVTLALSAVDDTGVTKYYASENSGTPSPSASGWKTYGSSVSFTLSDAVGKKTVYVWFQDAANNLSQSWKAQITYRATTTVGSLMWQDSSYKTIASWQTSLDYCNALNLAGYTDWGMPSLTELSALYTSRTALYSYEVNNYHWSSTTAVANPGNPSVVLFDKGTVSTLPSSYKAHVRCVRSISTDGVVPGNGTVVIQGNAGSTSTKSVTLTLSATDNTGVAQYYASETSTTPSATSGGWNDYATSVSFVLSSGDAVKTVYVWYKDAARNVSAAAATDTINYAAPPTTTIGGLVWQDNGLNTYYRWQNAVNYCAGLTLAGSSAWRLPTAAELTALYPKRTSLNSFLPGYWTSEPDPTNTARALEVNFKNGLTYKRDKANFNSRARCVR